MSLCLNFFPAKLFSCVFIFRSSALIPWFFFLLVFVAWFLHVFGCSVACELSLKCIYLYTWGLRLFYKGFVHQFDFQVLTFYSSTVICGYNVFLALCWLLIQKRQVIKYHDISYDPLASKRVTQRFSLHRHPLLVFQCMVFNCIMTNSYDRCMELCNTWKLLKA